jgi:hypothetical protein
MSDVVGWALLAAGAMLALSALPIRRPPTWPGWAMTYLLAFRRVVVGACVMALGVGLLADVTWLVAVSVCVGIGELLESTYYIVVMRWGAQRANLELSR